MITSKKQSAIITILTILFLSALAVRAKQTYVEHNKIAPIETFNIR